jgi:hypothetical protein
LSFLPLLTFRVHGQASGETILPIMAEVAMNTPKTTEVANSENATERSEIGKIVSIQDAINAYRGGRNSEAEGYRDLVTLLIDSGFDQPFKNDSYYDALVLTEAMLKRTNKRIKLLTGSACDGFYSAISEHFIAALDRIHKAGGEVNSNTLSR